MCGWIDGMSEKECLFERERERERARARARARERERERESVCSWVPTFSPDAPVSTNVEKTGMEYLVWAGQHSIVAPMGRQKRGTDSGRGKDS